MSEPFIGQIVMFGGNFAPRGWAFCDGQLLPIAQYQALFSILGTTYGGDGRTTFALPDLRGRAPIHAGHGPGLTDRRLGASGGAESVTLLVSEMPNHSHNMVGSTQPADDDNPSGNYPAKTSGDAYSQTSAPAPMAPGVIQGQGGSQPHNNMPPWRAVNYIIALQGLFPSRS